MNWKKKAKKIAALGTGALMLGATLTGALAQSAWDLGDYPAPFVEDGQLQNTVIVVGEAAQTVDVLGAVDIAASLQAAAVSEEEVDVSSTVAPTVTDGVKVEKSGDKFNYGEDIYDVMPEPLDSIDLPELLPDETFEDDEGANKGDTDYDQELQFSNGMGTLMLSQPEDMVGGTYLKFDKNAAVYTYTLEFDTSVDYSTSAATADLEGLTIDILGKTYTITEVSLDGSNMIDKLTLLAGDSTVWLVQDQPYTVGDHTVTIVDVDLNGEKCGVNVDGVTQWISEGSTKTMSGLSVGVLEALPVNTKDYDADTCELSLGSNELTLQEGEEISVNSADMEGTEVAFQHTSDGEWDGFTVTYELDVDDDIHLDAGGAWTDPVFGSWKVLFEGISANYETMEAETSGDDGTFTYMNNDKVEVVVPVHYDGSAVMWGTDDDEPLLFPGDTYGSDPEGALLFYTTSGGESHILEITDVTCGSSSQNKTTIKDVTYNTNVAKDEAFDEGNCGSGNETISLGSLGSIMLVIDESGVTYRNDFGDGTPESQYEGTLAFASDVAVTYTEKAGDEMAASPIGFNFSYDGSEEELVVVDLSGTDDGPVDFDEGDDDTTLYRTDKGSLLTYDAENKRSLVIEAPEEDAYGNVFVAPLSASVVSGSAGGALVTENVNPFVVGLAVLDVEAEDMDKNMIVVGGPCANTVAAEIMGNPENCVEGFEEGKAMVKYFDRADKAALLVAGYTAQDTLGASYVLADYEDYPGLDGDEVEVVVPTLSQISVNTV